MSECHAVTNTSPAAAASSNYAMAIAARGALHEAEVRLRQSLEYLVREPDLDTEIRTRAMLLRVSHARGQPPAACFQQARSLIDAHDRSMTANHRAVLRAALDIASATCSWSPTSSDSSATASVVRGP